MGFIFGGNTGETPESLARRREAADAIARQMMGRQPRNAMEGIGAMLQGAALGFGKYRDNKAEQAGRAQGTEMYENALKSSLRDQILGKSSGATPSSSLTPSANPSRSAASNLPPIEGTMENARTADRNSEQGYAGLDLKGGIRASADALGIDPADLATAISYETAGTFDPTKGGPTTKWGKHRGLIQFGEPQAQKYGVDWNDPINSQLGADGAVVKYLRDAGVKPGMGMMDVYSAINAGGVGRYDRSDAAAGGAPGTVADKVNNQMGAHREKALALLGEQQPSNAEQAINSQMQPVEVASNDPTAGMAQQAQQPQQMQQPQEMQPQQQTQVAQGPDPAILNALANPWVSEDQKAVLRMQLQQQMQQADPANQMALEEQRLKLDAMKHPAPDFQVVNGRDGSIFRVNKGTGEMETLYGAQPEKFRQLSPDESKRMGLDPSQAWQVDPKGKVMKIGGEGTNVTVNNAGENAFDKKLGEKQAETFNTMADEGMNAKADIAVIGELDNLMEGQGGTLTGFSGLAATWGIGGDGMNDLQAADALINKLVSSQRAPGSGSMSDRDVEMFKASLPSLWNQPGANKKIIGVMRGLAEYKQHQGEIADMVLTGEVSRQEARRMLREMPNPLEEFRKASGSAPKADAQKKQPVVIDGYSIEEVE